MNTDNNGIGALYGTFTIAQKDGRLELSSDDVGSAVVLTGNNEIGRAAGALLGKLENVSIRESLSLVQVKGVIRLAYNPDLCVPRLGDPVVVSEDGRIMRWRIGDMTPSGISGRGVTIAVDKNDCTCDVLL